jgi:hypothetical protein
MCIKLRCMWEAGLTSSLSDTRAFPGPQCSVTGHAPGCAELSPQVWSMASRHTVGSISWLGHSRIGDCEVQSGVGALLPTSRHTRFQLSFFCVLRKGLNTMEPPAHRVYCSTVHNSLVMDAT